MSTPPMPFNITVCARAPSTQSHRPLARCCSRLFWFQHPDLSSSRAPSPTQDCAAADTELADINQAIALSLALDAELRRMQLEQQHAGATAPETRQDEVCWAFRLQWCVASPTAHKTEPGRKSC